MSLAAVAWAVGGAGTASGTRLKVELVHHEEGHKGTMSEAELHILRQRMRQGALQKARRGELVSKVPIGYVRANSGEVDRDPDQQVQSTVLLIFEQFERLGSAAGLLRW